MQYFLFTTKLFRVTAVLLLTAACNASIKKEDKPTPAQYDLNHPQIIKLGDKLNEISGLSFYEKDSSLFAIVDEAGVLFKIILKGSKPDVQQWHFAKNADYEDIVLKDSIFYALKSKGDIVAFKFASPDSVYSQEYNIPAEGDNEFESLYYDPGSKKLILICKDCDDDDKTVVGTWSFDPASNSFSEGNYSIDVSAINEINEEQSENKKKFRPSAAAINPLTGDLYIISSINKLLVIADTHGKIKSSYALDADIYKQPEGIAFTKSGDMFISNEAAGEGLPNLLYFKHKK